MIRPNIVTSYSGPNGALSHLTEIPSPGHVKLSRLMDAERRIILSVGDFSDFLNAYEQHVAVWNENLDGLTETMMKQGLAGGVIHLSNAPRDESYGLTIHIEKPALNIFVAGDSPNSTVTGRAYSDGVKEDQSTRIYMQSSRPKREPHQSILAVDGYDVLDFYQEYYLNSEQRFARLFDLEDGRYMQVISLPGAESGFFETLDRAGAVALLEEGPALLEERTFFFQCGCTPQKMLRVLRTMFEHRPEDLFLGDPSVETSCPRCGRRWQVSRAEFEAPPEEET